MFFQITLFIKNKPGAINPSLEVDGV